MSEKQLPVLSLSDDQCEFVRSGAGLDTTWTDARIASLAEFIPARFRTLEHLVMFMSLAMKYELDPFAGEIWGWESERRFKVGGEWHSEPQFVVMVGRDGRTNFALRHPNVIGVIADIVYANDKFKWIVDQDLKIRVEHESTQLGGKPAGAYAIVQMRDGPDQGVRRGISDYTHLMDKPNWKKNLSTMLLSRVKSEAVTIGIAMPGVYTEPEMLMVETDYTPALMLEETEAATAEIRAEIEAEKDPPPEEKPEPQPATQAAGSINIGPPKEPEEGWTDEELAAMTCPECGKEKSTEADLCVDCGLLDPPADEEEEGDLFGS